MAAALEQGGEEDEDRLIEERRRRRQEILAKHQSQQALDQAVAAPTATQQAQQAAAAPAAAEAAAGAQSAVAPAAAAAVATPAVSGGTGTGGGTGEGGGGESDLSDNEEAVVAQLGTTQAGALDIFRHDTAGGGSGDPGPEPSPPASQAVKSGEPAGGAGPAAFGAARASGGGAALVQQCIAAGCSVQGLLCVSAKTTAAAYWVLRVLPPHPPMCSSACLPSCLTPLLHPGPSGTGEAIGSELDRRLAARGAAAEPDMFAADGDADDIFAATPTDVKQKEAAAAAQVRPGSISNSREMPLWHPALLACLPACLTVCCLARLTVKGDDRSFRDPSRPHSSAALCLSIVCLPVCRHRQCFILVSAAIQHLLLPCAPLPCPCRLGRPLPPLLVPARD